MCSRGPKQPDEKTEKKKKKKKKETKKLQLGRSSAAKTIGLAGVIALLQLSFFRV